MRISPINQTNQNSQLNFQAKLDKKFIKSVYYFCQQRALPVHMEKFEKKVGTIGGYGHKNSQFTHKNIFEGNEKTQVMVFSNPDINSKEGVVVCKSHRFGDFIDFIINLTKQDVKNYENILKM